jgi:Ca-activated chloride channel family protein
MVGNVSLQPAVRLAFLLCIMMLTCAALHSQRTLPPANALAAPGDDSLRNSRRIRVDVALVLVPVSVTDPAGKSVTGLDRENFRLFEDGIEQELVQVAEEAGPISVAMVFDVSGSMKKQFETARDTAMKFIGAAGKDDEFLLVQFERRAQLVTKLTQRLDELERRTQAAGPAGSTAMLDAVYLGLSQLRDARNPRRALLLITDATCSSLPSEISRCSAAGCCAIWPR